MLNQEDIIKGCRKNESSAQKQLYDLFNKKMYGICLRYISDKDAAKDILQDAFVKVFMDFNKYKGEGSLEGWLRRVFVTTALMHLRQKKKLNLEPLNDNTDSYALTTDDDENNSISTLDFTQEELFKTINLLPDDFKVVFNLFCVENYSHKEISNLLDINENTSRSRLNRARHLLQGHLLKLISTRKNVN